MIPRLPAYRIGLARYGADRSGAAAAEFALIAPFLLLILAALLDFGLFIWNKHALEFAIEESSRSLMTKATVNNAELITDLKARVLGIDPESIAATVTSETVGATTFVSITVGYTYHFVFVGYLGVDPIAIETKTRVPLNAISQ